MGAQTQNQRLAGDAAARMRASEGIRQRQAAIRSAGPESQSGPASMFPGEGPPGPGAPRNTPPGMPPGMGPGGPGMPPGIGPNEESMFRRQEITAARDQSGRREEMYRQFQQAQAEREAMARGPAGRVAPGGAVERGAGMFGAPFGGAGQGPSGPRGGMPPFGGPEQPPFGGPGGPRGGIAFGPGRSTRTPEPGTPEYNELVARMRGLGR